MEQHNTQVPSAREEAKRARPPCDEEPWVVADDEGLRLKFATESAAWRYRNEYTDRLVNPTVTYEPATQVPESVTSGMGEGRSLHAAIMNLPADKKVLAQMEGPPKGFYLLGHQAARHAAADLALRSDAINAELLEALEGLMELERRGRFMPIGREWDNARAAIEKATA